MHLVGFILRTLFNTVFLWQQRERERPLTARLCVYSFLLYIVVVSLLQHFDTHKCEYIVRNVHLNQISVCSIQMTINPETRYVFFWDVTHRIVVFTYRSLGTVYRSHLFENGTERFLEDGADD